MSVFEAAVGWRIGQCPPTLPEGHTFSVRRTNIHTGHAAGDQLTTTVALDASVRAGTRTLVLKGELIVRSGTGNPSYRETFLFDKQYGIDSGNCMVFFAFPAGIPNIPVVRVDSVTHEKGTKTYRGADYLGFLARMAGHSSSLVSQYTLGLCLHHVNQLVLSDDLRLQGKPTEPVGAGAGVRETVCKNGKCFEQKLGSAPAERHTAGGSVVGCPKTLAGSDYDLKHVGSENGAEVTTRVSLSVHPTTNTLTMRSQRHQVQGKSKGVTEQMVWNMGAYSIDQASCKLVLSTKMDSAKVDVVQINGDGSKLSPVRRGAQEYLNKLVRGMGGSLDGHLWRITSGGKFVSLSANLQLAKSALLANHAAAPPKSDSKPSRPTFLNIDSRGTRPASPRKKAESSESGSDSEEAGGCKSRLPANTEFRMTETAYDKDSAMILVVVSLSTGSAPGLAKLQTVHTYFEDKSKIKDFMEVKELPYVIDPKTCFLSFTGTKLDSVQIERTIAGTTLPQTKKQNGIAYVKNLLKIVGSKSFSANKVLGKVEGSTIRLGPTLLMKKI